MTNAKSIFLAEDDFDDIMFFQEALTELCDDVTLTITSSGQKVLEILRKITPPKIDMIFLDINMPQLNGLECLKAIRSTDTLKEIPINILTTSSDHETIREAFRLGANFYAVKPPSIDELKIILTHILYSPEKVDTIITPHAKLISNPNLVSIKHV